MRRVDTRTDTRTDVLISRVVYNASVYTRGYEKSFNLKWLDLIGSIAYVLSELSEGHQATHKLLYAGGILKEVGFYLHHTHKINCLQVCQIQKRCPGVVGSILELNAYHGTQFAFDISKSIDMVTIRLAMNNFYFIDFFCRTWGDETGRIFPSTPDSRCLSKQWISLLLDPSSDSGPDWT